MYCIGATTYVVEAYWLAHYHSLDSRAHYVEEAHCTRDVASAFVHGPATGYSGHFTIECSDF